MALGMVQRVTWRKVAPAFSCCRTDGATTKKFTIMAEAW